MLLKVALVALMLWFTLLLLDRLVMSLNVYVQAIGGLSLLVGIVGMFIFLAKSILTYPL